jgi:hypothetical protein
MAKEPPSSFPFLFRRYPAPAREGARVVRGRRIAICLGEVNLKQLGPEAMG